jgi:RimJ/RimL family protein N-acetyltransferase
MDEIRLVEPFPAWQWPLAWAWFEGSRRFAADDFSPCTAEAFVEYSNGAYATTFGVERGGRLGGAIAFQQASPATAIMHVLFAPWFIRQRGAAGRACREACRRLLAATRTVKILALIPANNRLAIALARRNGGRVEGLLRSHTLRDGKPLDAVAVGITREEFEALEHGTEFRGNELQQCIELVEHADVQRPSERAAEHATERAPVVPANGGDRRHRAKRFGSTNAKRGHDQQKLLVDRRPDEQVSGGARIRTKRPKRADAVADGAGKAGRAGDKQLKRRRPATQSK